MAAAAPETWKGDGLVRFAEATSSSASPCARRGPRLTGLVPVEFMYNALDGRHHPGRKAW